MKVIRLRKTRGPQILATLAAASLATGMIPSVNAQNSAVLEEVIVTARKVLESMQDVPVSVTAFSGQTIDNLNIRDFQDFEGLTPNVVVDSLGGVVPGGGSFYIRGVGTQEVEKSFDPAVGVVLDGVPLSYINGTFVNPYDFSSLEILRGPQGTLFGRNTTGGVFNVTRSTPTGELGMRYQVTFGEGDRLDATAIINFPIIEDKLAGKITATSLNDGGWTDNKFSGKTQGDADVTDFTGTLFWTPTDNVQALLIYENYDDQSDQPGLQNIAENGANNSVNPPPGELTCFLLGYCGYPGDPEDTNQDFPGKIDYTFDAWTLNVDWEINMGTITSITGYRDGDDFTQLDFDGVPIGVLHVQRDQTSETKSQEFRFASSDEFSEAWDFVAGFYYMEDEYIMRQDTEVLGVFGPPPASTLVANIGDQERDTWSMFGEAHIRFAEDWTLTLGGRYTQESKDYLGTGLIPLPDGSDVQFSQASGDEDWDEFTPKVGVDWSYSDDLLFYATYAEGFRSGGFNGRNTSDADIGPYDPEYVDQYEVGMKGDFVDNTLRVNVAVFYSDYQDKQEEVILPDPIQGSITIVKNASDVELAGLESEITWVANENLTFTANIGYLDASYDDYVADLNGDGNETDNSDLELRRTPDWTGGITGTYQRRLGPGMISFYAAYRYTDEYWVEAANDPRGLLDAQDIVDVSVSYDWEWTDDRTVRISAFGRDITNDPEVTSAVIIPGLLAFGGVSRGSNWGLRISGNF